MSFLFAVVVMALIGAMVFMIWLFRRRTEERERAEQARAAAFLSGLAGATKSAEPAPPHVPMPPASPPHAPAPVAVPHAPVPHAHNDLALQKLLFEAAHKAGEANEPALAIQLYARLLARYPATSFAEPARAAAAALKKKLVKS
jgi:hypothetical protein